MSAYGILLERGERRGWSVDTCLLILCDYFDLLGDEAALEYYLDHAEAEEEEMGLRRDGPYATG